MEILIYLQTDEKWSSSVESVENRLPEDKNYTLYFICMPSIKEIEINLSNTNDTDSINAEIAADGDNVLVTWWERANATSNQPVLRISTDNGQTFGPLIQLSTNGTIGSSNDTE